jgi:hypothetical protein
MSIDFEFQEILDYFDSNRHNSTVMQSIVLNVYLAGTLLRKFGKKFHFIEIICTLRTIYTFYSNGRIIFNADKLKFHLISFQYY